MTQDANVERIRQKLLERSQRGIAKYGTTTERTDLSRLQWLQHAQEELLDGAVYMERLIQDEMRLVEPELTETDRLWRCPKCRRWQPKNWALCQSEYDTGIPCDGTQVRRENRA